MISWPFCMVKSRRRSAAEPAVCTGLSFMNRVLSFGSWVKSEQTGVGRWQGQPTVEFYHVLSCFIMFLQCFVYLKAKMECSQRF